MNEKSCAVEYRVDNMLTLGEQIRRAADKPEVVTISLCRIMANIHGIFHSNSVGIVKNAVLIFL